MTTERPDTDARQRRPGRLLTPKDGPDFPLYERKPVDIAGWKWIVMLAAAVVGLALIVEVQSDNQVVTLIVRIAFLAIPLAAFIILAGPHVSQPGHRQREQRQRDRVFYLSTFIRILGEEVFSLIPFLALLYLAHTKLNLSWTAGIIIAWLGTAIWCGAGHLSTYDWNLIQAFVVIGLARIIVTAAYIRTKNVLVPFGLFLLTDWSIFTLTLIAVATGAA